MSLRRRRHARARHRRYIRLAVPVVMALGILAARPGNFDAQSLRPDGSTEQDLARASGGRIVRVGNVPSGLSLELPLEVYVARVLAGEGEPGAADAAQQALAIAIRTFALANANRHGRDGFDLCDTTHCQVIRAATPVSRRAALATAGEILSIDGQPAEVFYSASCGGQSELPSVVWPGARYPYLRSVRDDVHDDDLPWTLDVTLPEVEARLRRSGFDGALARVAIEARSESGRVVRLRVEGLQPGTVSGEQLRQVLGQARLRSTSFSLNASGSLLQFVGRGYGHGVGMCVIGAGRRARRGESVHAILAQYYPGLTLTTAPVLSAASTSTTKTN